MMDTFGDWQIGSADELEWRKNWYEFIWVMTAEQAETDLLYRAWLDTRK